VLEGKATLPELDDLSINDVSDMCLMLDVWEDARVRGRKQPEKK
jgi:hypothetical protein